MADYREKGDRKGRHGAGVYDGYGSQDYLRGLNPPQRAAVESLDGPLLILAGAGTGKTRALTARLAHILCSNKAWPSQLLAVTFTNKAAAEMRERVALYLNQGVDEIPWLGTYHAICARILRQRAELAGLKPNFTILDSDDQVRLARQVISAEGLDEKKIPPRAVSAVIDRWKNRGWMPRDVPDRFRTTFDGYGVNLYRQYQERLTTLNAVDFGDLILRVVGIFKENEDILAMYQRRFRYILVDEYQDTNIAQYHWLRLLAQAHRNICCVGDDDQSIYGWRGAEVELILNFETDFPGARVIRLEQNYRSTPHILAAASGLIGHNRDRLGKTLWTDMSGGEKVMVSCHPDGREEASWIGREIEALNAGIGRRRYDLNDMAVMVRASFQNREIEDCFLSFGIPYRVIGGLRFYERREIRDALAYLRLAVSANDDLAFERVINVPRRGIGEKTQLMIRKEALRANVCFAAAAARLLAGNHFPPRASRSIRTFLENLKVWSEWVKGEQLSAGEIAGKIIDESGLSEMWLKDDSPTAEGRLENLKVFVDSIGDYGSLVGFLEHIALQTERNLEIVDAAVSIMTMHAAKGLEFPVVFLPGWEEGIFPSRKALNGEDRARSLEEERRLAYVAVTRARELAIISFARRRSIFYRREQTVDPSMFIHELPTRHIEEFGNFGLGLGLRKQKQYGSDYGGQYAGSNSRSHSMPYETPGFQRMQKHLASPGRSRNATIGHAPPDSGAADRFSVGERIFHQKFGYGSIVSIENDAVSIDFEKASPRKIMASYIVKADAVG